MEKLPEVMEHPTLSSSAKVAYWWLRRTARDGCSYETNRSLARRLGVAEERVTHLSRELAAAKLVRREAAGKGAGVLKRWVLLSFAIATGAAGSQEPANAGPTYNQPAADYSSRSIIKGQKRRRRRRQVAA